MKFNKPRNRLNVSYASRRTCERVPTLKETDRTEQPARPQKPSPQDATSLTAQEIDPRACNGVGGLAPLQSQEQDILDELARAIRHGSLNDTDTRCPAERVYIL
jgi:hypothetical protein